MSTSSSNRRNGLLLFAIILFLGMLAVSWLNHGTGVIQNDASRSIYIPKQLTMPLQVQVGFPVAAAPVRVARVTTGSSNAPDLEPGPGTALTAAPSLAAFQASPLTTYFYESSRGVLHAFVTESWLVVTR